MQGPPDASNDELTEAILEVAIELHKELGPHQREAAYRRALAVGLRKEDLQTAVEYEFDVEAYGTVVGKGAADLLVEEEVVLELKCVKAMTEDHFRQLGRNVEGCGASRGLLLNFGSSTLGIRRYVDSSGGA